MDYKLANLAIAPMPMASIANIQYPRAAMIAFPKSLPTAAATATGTAINAGITTSARSESMATRTSHMAKAKMARALINRRKLN
jgi:hypothetical protein